MNDGHQHDDSYSVDPSAMDPEQIARRDAASMSIVELAEHVAAQSVTLNVQLEQLCKSVERLERERDEMRAALKDIVYEFHNTYDAEIETDGRWHSAASIPVSVMNRAEKILGAL